MIKKAGGTLHESYLDEGYILDKKIGVGQVRAVFRTRGGRGTVLHDSYLEMGRSAGRKTGLGEVCALLSLDQKGQERSPCP